MRAERGQGTVEYVAIVALVTFVLVVAGAAAGGPGVANAVGRSLRHALCRVGAGTCATVDPAPCTLRTSTLRGGFSGKVLLLRVGRDTAIVRTERSDGTVDVTLLEGGSAGVAATLGASGGLRIGGVRAGLGAAAEGALLATLGGGRTWRLRGAREADAFVRRLVRRVAARGASALPGIGPALDLGQRILRRGAHGPLPEPDSTTTTGGVRAKGDVELGPLAGVSGDVAVTLGRRRARDGSTTWTVRLSAGVSRPLRRAVGVTAGADGGVVLALAYDPAGRLRRLDVSASGAQAKRATLRGMVVGTGRHVEAAAALDLTSGDDALVRALLSALRPDRAAALPGAVVALATAIADRGALDVATYRDDRVGGGVDVSAGVGVAVGGSLELSRARSTLTGAWTRPPGGAWERRGDCAGRA